ncbi:cholecystokinin receptor type A-like [Asterias amurensis]|uniref:cholecystokinin receptor type A-like n=1 Tax=Asterias amurensis TaxID=7602 RepID=UPI003AB2D2B6
MENASIQVIVELLPVDVNKTSLFTYGERVGVAIVLLIIFVLGTLGNSIVILAVALSKDLHTIPNVFVVSLAIADLCYCLLLPSSSVIPLLSRVPWRSETLCFLSALMAYTSVGASLYNLACIALNRLLVIRGPAKARKWLFTTKKIAIMVAGTWAIPLAAILVPLPFGIGALGLDKQDNTCSDIDTHPRSIEYHLIQVFCFYPLPLMILIISYSLLFFHVHYSFKHRRESFKLTHQEMSDFRTDDDTMQDKLKARFKKRTNRQQLQITKNLFIVSCVFVVCGAPYSVALLTTSNARILLFLSVLFTFNSCVNPILYTVNHSRFKVVILCILRCRLKDIPKPSALLVSLRATFCRV